jgi:O-antigen ligase
VGSTGRTALSGARKGAQTKRRRARRAAARATVQLLVVLVGGLVSGALAVLAVVPGGTEPIPPGATVVAAGAVAVVTLAGARRLRPVAQGRSRR